MARLLLCLCLLFPLLSWADESLEFDVLALRHRPASEIIPLLQPLLASDQERLTGSSYTLVIRATPQSLARIREAISRLDVPLQRLQIQVRLIRDMDTGQSGDNLSGRVGSGPDTLHYRITRSNRSQQGETTMQVTTLDGRPAYIDSGNLLPSGEWRIAFGRHGVAVQHSTHYLPLTRGFQVLPRLHGDQVDLLLSLHDQRLARPSGQIDVLQSDTTVSGPLGEWLEIGAISEQDTSHQGGLVYSTRQREQRHYLLLIRVISSY